MEKGDGVFTPLDRIGQLTMRNLDIADHARLSSFTTCGAGRAGAGPSENAEACRIRWSAVGQPAVVHGQAAAEDVKPGQQGGSNPEPRIRSPSRQRAELSRRVSRLGMAQSRGFLLVKLSGRGYIHCPRDSLPRKLECARNRRALP
jgi:hypothetical protein